MKVMTKLTSYMKNLSSLTSANVHEHKIACDWCYELPCPASEALEKIRWRIWAQLIAFRSRHGPSEL